MAVYVNTNVSSLNGQRYLNNVQNSLNTTYTRLSSGLRINSAKDDSAGLQIADRLTSQINGLNQGNRNANDGIALAQTIEGGLDEISNMLQRIRTLAVQSANGTLGADDRKSIQNEATDTTFGGKKILAGSSKAGGDFATDVGGSSIYGGVSESQRNGVKVSRALLTLHVGANTDDTIVMRVDNFMFSTLAVAAGLKVNGTYAADTVKETGFYLSGQNEANASIEQIDAMISIVDSQRADLVTPLTPARVSATQTSLRSRLTCRSSPLSSRLLPRC